MNDERNKTITNKIGDNTPKAPSTPEELDSLIDIREAAREMRRESKASKEKLRNQIRTLEIRLLIEQEAQRKCRKSRKLLKQLNREKAAQIIKLEDKYASLKRVVDAINQMRKPQLSWWLPKTPDGLRIVITKILTELARYREEFSNDQS